ncbi:hypothetical protein ACFQZ4_05370 [Catellatospora coxensis]
MSRSRGPPLRHRRHAGFAVAALVRPAPRDNLAVPWTWWPDADVEPEVRGSDSLPEGAEPAPGRRVACGTSC